MKRFEKLVVALLVVIAIATTVTAVEMGKIVRNGFTIEMSDDVD